MTKLKNKHIIVNHVSRRTGIRKAKRVLAKKIGEEFQNPLIVTGSVLFTPHARSGFVQREQEYYDTLGRRRVVPVRTYMERKGFILRPKFIFIDGRNGTTLYSETFREEILYSPQQSTPALSSYFELMDRLVPSFLSTLIILGAVALTGQATIIFLASIALIVLLYLFFERTLTGKALRATAVNRAGARLMGISSSGAGRLAFLMAALIGALSGLLIGPTTTIFYDSGFLIGLKGFVAAVFGGLASYPLALFGALGVGLLESFGSFYASAFKEVIVFSAILPVLLWRSLSDPHSEEH